MYGLLLAIIYLSFISLGLPDTLLGAAWPSMYVELGASVSAAGILSMIIALGTITSCLLSDRMTKKLGTGKITAASVALTAAALFGFSVSHSFLALCLWAVPYGLGAGSVDAALNNYVALHYKSRQMSWLHCMWGVGASVGPYIMGRVLTSGVSWNSGYRIISLLQLGLTVILVLSLPLWRPQPGAETSDGGESSRPLPLREVVAIPGVFEVMTAFFFYCAVEQTTCLWASSYLVLSRGIAAETAAGYASLFIVGITVGRLIGGFLTMKLSDSGMIRLGQGVMAVGVVMLLFASRDSIALAALIVIGLGCGPVFPCIIHATPERFGADRSQAVVGVEMASSYVGICVMPPLFGLLARFLGTALLPYYLCVSLALMVWMHERLLKKRVAT